MSKHPDKIKRFILLLLAWVVAVVAIVAGSFIYSAHQESKYAPTAVPYVKQVLPVLAQWNVAETKALMAQEALADISDENLDRAMRLFAKLGTLQDMSEPRFKEVVDDDRDDSSTRTLVTYEIRTRFSKGDALFKLQLIDRGNAYEVFNFNLSSETLTGKQ